MVKRTSLSWYYIWCCVQSQCDCSWGKGVLVMYCLRNSYMGTVIWEQLYGNNVERARHKLGIRKHNMSCCTSTCTQQSLPLGSSLQAYREETQTQAGLKAELSNLRNPHSKTGIHGFESQWVNYSKITSPYYLFTESSIYSLCELNSKLYL